MAGISVDQAQAQLDLWIEANARVASAQSYEISTGNGSTRRLTRADAAEIRAQIDYWRAMVSELTPASAGGLRRVSYIVPE